MANYTLTILSDTYFKQATEQASELPSDKKVFVKQGQQYPLSSFVQSQSQHTKFSLGKDDRGIQMALQGKNTWYAYAPHVQVLQDGQPFNAAHTTGTRAIGAAGLALIKEFEGCVLSAYQDCVGVWTIGYGSTQGVFPGETITQEQAETLLKKDLRRFELAVSWMVTAPINRNQFDALTSFAFNLGEAALQGSTLLRLLNQGDYENAANQFLLWTYADGKEFAGLVRRRQAERSLFLSP